MREASHDNAVVVTRVRWDAVYLGDSGKMTVP